MGAILFQCIWSGDLACNVAIDMLMAEEGDLSLRVHRPGWFQETNYRTTDQPFEMRSLIEFARAQREKMECAFVDFPKADDRVPRNRLWTRLPGRARYPWTDAEGQARCQDVQACF